VTKIGHISFQDLWHSKFKHLDSHWQDLAAKFSYCAVTSVVGEKFLSAYRLTPTDKYHKLTIENTENK
jgi:hypothetical protein